MRKNDNVEFTTSIGNFAIMKNKGFDDTFASVQEHFSSVYQLDIIGDAATIMKSDTFFEAYKESLISDVVTESESIGDAQYAMLGAKLDQLMENSRYELVRESTVGQMEPVVGLSLAVLKKNFLSNNAKDVINTEVPTKPIIKLPFERDFLKDTAGNKYYIPEIYYDDSYRDVIQNGKGIPMPTDWVPSTGSLPIHKFDALGHAGGSLAARDTLNMDFSISAVKLLVPTGSEFMVDGVKVATNADIEPAPITGLSIMPKQGTNGAINQNVTFDLALTTTNTTPAIAADTTIKVDMVVLGEVDFYAGLVSVATSPAYGTNVVFGGHLSNVNNTRTLELDSERDILEWTIPDNFRINTGLTVEKIKDFNVLFDIDVTTKYVHLMGDVLTQTEDSETFRFLEDSLMKWKDKTSFPFGYTDGFTERKSFSAQIPANKVYSNVEYIEKDLKFAIDRFLQSMKQKLRTPEIMFVVYGHPNIVSLLNANVRWVIDNDTRVGGVQLDYRFGVMTNSMDRVHVVSSMKVDEELGLRFVVFPTTPTTYTFKHYKYSFNIENTYRNPITTNIPNVMGTSRYLTTEVLPVQGQIKITDRDYGLVNL